jgi:hypothetical protein
MPDDLIVQAYILSDVDRQASSLGDAIAALLDKHTAREIFSL